MHLLFNTNRSCWCILLPCLVQFWFLLNYDNLRYFIFPVNSTILVLPNHSNFKVKCSFLTTNFWLQITNKFIAHLMHTLSEDTKQNPTGCQQIVTKVTTAYQNGRQIHHLPPSSTGRTVSSNCLFVPCEGTSWWVLNRCISPSSSDSGNEASWHPPLF